MKQLGPLLAQRRDAILRDWTDLILASYPAGMVAVRANGDRFAHPLASAVAMDKKHSKWVFTRNRLPHAPFTVLTRKDILTQVLIESATLSTVGAGFGIAVGLGIAQLIAAVSVMPAAVSPRWIALGVGLGLTVGIVAGVYPATQASKLDPVDALRYE